MYEVHRGSCGTAPSEAREPVRYCLHDQTGRPIGTIPAPAALPTVGTSAPTIYLRREPM